MQLSVIIVSYNVKYYLEQCLHSVITACNNINAEIIVIDNASSDNSINYLKLKFPGVIFIENEINAGFAKANNKVLYQAKGKYILYLNPDTILSENVISNCISFLEEHSEAGAVGVKMIDANGNFLPESKRAFPSLTASFFKLSGLASLFPHSSVFNKYALGNLNEDAIHEVDVLSGAFFLSSKEILVSLNGFDEDFFMYGEDIDLSYRIQKAGYKNYYLGNNIIIHFKGESTQTYKQDYIKNFYGAMKIFAAKHYKTASLSLLKSAINAGAILSSAKKIIRHSFSSTKKEKTTRSFILVGSERAAQSAAAILSHNNHSFKIISAERLHSLVASYNSLKENLVFCTDRFSYSDFIGFIQNNKNKFVYHWHYKDSAGIVSGSNASAVPQIYIAV